MALKILVGQAVLASKQYFSCFVHTLLIWLAVSLIKAKFGSTEQQRGNSVLWQNASNWYWREMQNCWKYCLTKIYRGTTSLTKSLHVLCFTSELSTPFWKIMHTSYSNLSKELKKKKKIALNLSRPSRGLDQNDIFTFLIHNLKTANLLKFQWHVWVPWTICFKIFFFSYKCR